MTHICVSKLTIIGSDNGLSPGWHQAIIWTNAGILLIRPLGTNISEILIVIYIFSFNKIHLKLSSGNGGHFELHLNSIGLYGPLDSHINLVWFNFIAIQDIVWIKSTLAKLVSFQYISTIFWTFIIFQLYITLCIAHKHFPTSYCEWLGLYSHVIWTAYQQKYQGLVMRVEGLSPRMAIDSNYEHYEEKLGTVRFFRKYFGYISIFQIILQFNPS